MVWEMLRLNVSFFFWGGGECFSGEGWDRSLKTVRYIKFSLWWRRLLSNVSKLRLVSMVVTDPVCLER